MTNKPAQLLFEALLSKFCKQDGVAPGKMMSAPAMKYRGKVFAFFYKEEMTFKLGKDFDADAYGISNWTYLSPFKNKPPMKAWITVSATQSNLWEALTQKALDQIAR